MKESRCGAAACAMPKEDIVGKILSVRGKLRYTQGVRRDDIEKGYADCSSLVRWAYRSIGIDIGEDTAAQIVSPAGADVDCAGVRRDTQTNGSNKKGSVCVRAFYRIFFGQTRFPMPDTAHLMPGDLLFFTGEDRSRPFCVGHVEMYLGGGKIIGQNDRPYRGPTVKDMRAYIDEIGRRGHFYIKTRRFVNGLENCRHRDY